MTTQPKEGHWVAVTTQSEASKFSHWVEALKERTQFQKGSLWDCCSLDGEPVLLPLTPEIESGPPSSTLPCVGAHHPIHLATKSLFIHHGIDPWLTSTTWDYGRLRCFLLQTQGMVSEPLSGKTTAKQKEQVRSEVSSMHLRTGASLPIFFEIGE